MNKKFNEKVFTKKEAKDIISKNYNPFEVNYKIYKRRDGLYMENIVLNEVKKELGEKYGTKEKVVEILFEKCKELGYNINKSREMIMEFFRHK